MTLTPPTLDRPPGQVTVERDVRYSQLSTREAELLAVLHTQLAWTDWAHILRPEGMHMHEALAESAHESRREVNRVWLQREARTLWFDAVTSDGARYEDDDSDSDDSMPDLPMPEDSDTEDDDDMPDLELVPFEDEVVAAAA